jgi:hypothetical protein
MLRQIVVFVLKLSYAAVRLGERNGKDPLRLRAFEALW